MTNLTRDVQRILDHDVALKRDLSRDVINKKALAEYLKKKRGINGTVDAIISAIRRYESDFSETDHFSLAGGIIKDAKISTRTGIAIIAFVKDSAVQSHLPKLFSIIHYDRAEVLRIIQAEQTIKVIVDEKNVAKVIDLVGSSKVLKTEHKLAEITMQLNPNSAKVIGILAILNNELASNEINIVETISCVPELLWFIDQKELLKAHQTFLELISSLKKN